MPDEINIGKVSFLGSRLKDEIKRTGQSQLEFAKKLGISPSRLSNYVTGARLPDIFTLNSIADLLGIPLDSLLSDDYDCKGRRFPRRYLLTVYEGGSVSISEETALL
ncbi:transcriptional regulator, XRE family [Denitrovibrio acetiphilus DSM 12809]|uniref:Transcriptional regulator, XRE family n=1 Tax=Denitrovibrio acetiphilus (strain DSM 12809 / NBRC 114555 / N2460) TaxID=522772 RepID=D4H0I0_DENA2|nr:helix-turn-helix transcriptional regulator [Denitrovibrio acetiphilus]ADD68493.1 transcriptional regulator, XRE family [Denitrovibrio acetiphilus DSM 12809]